jgi:SAM-dependent methyltransferase
MRWRNSSTSGPIPSIARAPRRTCTEYSDAPLDPGGPNEAGRATAMTGEGMGPLIDTVARIVRFSPYWMRYPRAREMGKKNFTLQRIRHRLRKSLAQRGVLSTAATLLRKTLRPAPRTFDAAKEYAEVHPFDRQYGVDTSKLIAAEDLSSGKPKDLYKAGYFGVAPSVLRQILNRLQLDFEEYTFIDLGSGKGRALLIASEYPFRAIVGVELSPRLHAIAVENLARCRGLAQRCRNVRSIEGDATEFNFPAGPLVIYLWNPFEAPVFASVLVNLEAALRREQRRVYIVYIQPDLESMLEGSRLWHEMWREELPMSEEDYAAHAFPARVEICSVFRSVLPTGEPMSLAP